MLFRRLGLPCIAGVVALVGTGFLVAAAYIWLATLFRPPAAAGIMGGALVVIALLLLLVARAGGAARAGFPAPEQVALAALRLVTRSIRAAPEKALIAAVIAGVLSEWLGERNRRDR